MVFDLNKILESHKKWLNKEDGGKRADLSGADLSGVDLSGADLSRANLRGADISRADFRDTNFNRANLTGIAMKLFQVGLWTAIITPDEISIGCQRHSADKWVKFQDEEIAQMHDDALQWWRENKVIVLGIAQSMQE